ncbi:MAG TPA: M48 family metallopeptidase [Blastocatellia bacterium]|nr:M48 family metallopeptidase [Blastocatellia bacterium]
MKFRCEVSKRLASFAIALAMLAGPPLALARDDEKKAEPAKTETTKKVDPLKDKENPLMIGKRDINKGNIDFYSLEKEANLGRQLAAEIDGQGKFITDPVVTEYINRIGQNIALRSDAKIPFTIKVLDSADVNAFALPGGFLYVNSGLVLAADNEAEIIGVMAHEIAHVAARHGVEQASKGRLFQFLSIPLIFVAGPLGAIAQNAVNILVPLTFLKFSRGAEEEADRLGLQYMWAAGYDPTSMLSFFEKLKSKEKKKPGTLEKVFSTHPPTGNRIEKARALLVRFPERDEYMLSTSEFNNVKERLLAITNQSKLGNGDSTGPSLKRKPTLKRGDSDGKDDSEKDKPTLKRKPDGDN